MKIMPMFNKILSPFGVRLHKASRVGSNLQTSTLRAAAEREFDKFRILDFYYKDPWFYSVVNAVSCSTAQLPFRIFMEDEDSSPIFVTDSPVVSDFVRKPNPWQTWWEFIYLTFINLETNGNFFWEITQSPGGVPEMYVLRSANMEIQWKPRGERQYRYQPGSSLGRISGVLGSGGGKTVVFQESEVIHGKWPDPQDDFKGMPPLQSTLYELVVSLLARTFNMSFIENGARPSGVVTTAEDLDGEMLKLYKEQFRESQQGAKNSGETFFIGKGDKYEQVSLSPVDMEFLNLLKAAREAILSVMRVPPVIVGVFEFANYANSDIQKRLFWEEALLPRISMFNASMSQALDRIFVNQLTGQSLNLKAMLDTSDVEALRPDQEKLANVNSTLVAAGIKTRNEARKTMNEEQSEDPAADVLTTTAGTMALMDAIDSSSLEDDFQLDIDELDLDAELSRTVRRENGLSEKPRIIDMQRRRVIKPISASA